MRTRNCFLGAALAAATLIPAAAPAATIVGDWVQVLATSSDGQGYWDVGVVHVGAPTSTLPDLAVGMMNVDVTSSQIVLTWTRSDVTFSEPVRGLEFIDLTHPFTSATAAIASPGVALSFLGGDVFINLTKVMQTRGETYTVDVTRAAAGVPEPAPWAIMLVGLTALGTVVRARRRPAAGLT